MFAATTPEAIERVRLITLYHALSLEIKTGLKRSNRGRATGTLIREATGLRTRSKSALLAAFDLWLKQRGLRECKHRFTEIGYGTAQDGSYSGPVGYCAHCKRWIPGKPILDTYTHEPVGFDPLPNH